MQKIINSLLSEESDLGAMQHQQTSPISMKLHHFSCYLL